MWKQIRQRLLQQDRAADFEEGFGRGIGLDDEAIGRDGQHRMRQRVQQPRSVANSFTRLLHVAPAARALNRSLYAHAATARSSEFEQTFQKRFNFRRILADDEALSQTSGLWASHISRVGRQMLARMAQPLRYAHKSQQGAIMFQRHGAARCGLERRELRHLCQMPRDLTDEPRAANRGAPDHHRIGAGKPQHFIGIREAFTVAIGDNGQRRRLLHLPDCGPVGIALVELTPAAAVHRQHGHPFRFGAAGEFRRIQGSGIPAEPHFHRHRHFDSAHNRANKADREIEIAHQGRTRETAGNTLGGTAHVDVDHHRPRSLGTSSAFRHRLGPAARNLHDMMRDPRAFRPQGRRWIAIKVKVRIKHFRDRERSAETLRRATHAEVRDTGHGGEESAPI